MSPSEQSEQSGGHDSLERRESQPGRDIQGWYARQDRAQRTDTSATLEPLQHASPEQWLGTNNDPDVLLSIPNLGVDHIGINVENLRAHVNLRARVLDLVDLEVGADVSIDKVEVDIENVRVQAMLKVRLDRVVDIIEDVVGLLDHHPEIVTNLTAGLGKGLEAGLGREHATEIEKQSGPLKGVEEEESEEARS